MAAPTISGQFDDATEDKTIKDPRQGHTFIDEDILAWSDTSEQDQVAHSQEEDDYESDHVEDEDWEIAERDFTKQYNRLRQHVAVRTGNAQGTTSSINSSAKVAALPPVNQPKKKAADVQGTDKATDQLAALSKYSSRLAKINVPYTMGVGVNRKGPSAHANLKDKADRATTEQVLDPRTRVILLKMIGRGLIAEVNGCVSTGKEANVYHAVAPDNKHIALKIYKTSILIFKDRDRYVTGEHRFRRGYSRNPRKMVKLWAEKEMRNLKRLVAVGVPCPEPIEVRENVLVMDFLGDSEGWASPRLKDADLPSSSCAPLYSELVLVMRKLFHQCKLVHADLSEYNILYHNSHLYIIDVSQSVEHDHPSAFDFLRNDVKNVEDFFGRLGVRCLGLRRCFEFVTKDIVIQDREDEQQALERWLATTETPTAPESADGHEDTVFMKSFIPRNLTELYDPERDAEAVRSGKTEGLIYKDTIGLVDHKMEQVQPEEDVADEPGQQEEDKESGNEASDDSEEESSFKEKQPRGHRHEDREEKKQRKKAAKEEAREKRKNKMPKAEKKRLIKKTSNR